MPLCCYAAAMPLLCWIGHLDITLCILRTGVGAQNATVGRGRWAWAWRVDVGGLRGCDTTYEHHLREVLIQGVCEHHLSEVLIRVEHLSAEVLIKVCEQCIDVESQPLCIQ